MSEKKNEMIVREGSDKEPMYWTGSEPTMLDKAKNKVGEVAGSVYDQAVKSLGKNSALRQDTVKVMKKMAKGGKVSSASSRADGCATKGKTKGKIC